MIGDIGGTQGTRRALLSIAAGLASSLFFWSGGRADEQPFDPADLIKRITGKTATESDRVRLDMPHAFPNGYSVPLAFIIDSPMTEADHVKNVRVFAPRNPIIEVAAYHFFPQRSEPRISTRIRLAEPQDVMALAELNDGTLLFATRRVEVATNGCK